MEKGTLEITKDERDLLIAGLRSIKITGTMENLTQAIERLMELAKKIQGVFEEENDGTSREVDGD